jgi:hypothetical protein
MQTLTSRAQRRQVPTYRDISCTKLEFMDSELRSGAVTRSDSCRMLPVWRTTNIEVRQRMSSRQINFFLTQTDQADLMRRLGPLGELAFIEGMAQGRHPQFLESAEVKQMGAETLQIFLARPEDVKDILFREARETTYLDVVRSPVIEFNRCYRDQHLLRRGRLYFVTRYYE